MNRSIGLIGYTFIGVSGVIGSGWLFGPLLTSQLAGPSSLVAWLIGAVAMLVLALCYAEVAAFLPVAGGIARIPEISHGRLTANLLGWTAWLGYAIAAPIETAVTLQYLAKDFPWLYSDASTLDDLSTAGRWVALAILAVFVVVNALGAAFFARTNTLITWFKLLIPLLVAVSLIAMHFEPGNFTAAGGFAPDGVHGILSAISAGGIIYAYLGFRHAIDMSGEVRRPQVTIPLALTLIIVICALVYLLLQVSFIGALSAEDLEHGWTGLAFGHHLGPIAGVVLGLGLTWLTVSLYAGAILGPVGSALVATGSNARLTKVLADVNLFSPVFARLSSRAVPLNAMLLNLAVGAAVVLWVPFEEAVTLNSASITLSLAAGPLAVYSLRLQLPDAKRRFRLPAVRLMALAGFTLVTLIIYWSGWETTWRLGLALLTGAALVFVRHALSRNGLSALELRGAAWLLPYGVGLGLLSYLGDFSGGLRLIPFGWDLLAGVVLSLAIFPYALHCRLDPERTRRYAAEATAEAGR